MCVPDRGVVQGEADGIVEGQTEGLVHILTASSAIKEIRLEVVEDREEDAARLVGRDIAVGARNALRDGGCQWQVSTTICKMIIILTVGGGCESND